MKKAIFTILFCSICIFTVLGQETADNTNRLNDKNIYNLTIKKYIEQLHNERNRKIETDTLLFETYYSILDSILPQIDQITIFEITIDNRENYFANHATATIHRIFPIGFENGEFYVSIIPYGVGYKKKQKFYMAFIPFIVGLRSNMNYTYVHGGGYRFYYRFENGLFVFDRVYEWGI